MSNFHEAMRLRQRLMQSLPQRDGEQTPELAEVNSQGTKMRGLTSDIMSLLSEGSPVEQLGIDGHGIDVVESIVVEDSKADLWAKDTMAKSLGQHGVQKSADSPTAAEKTQVKITVAKNQKVEAYGVKGAKSTSWRKTFKNADALNKWLEQQGGNAECYGVRDVE